MPRIAIVVTDAGFRVDTDPERDVTPLLEALLRCGAEAERAIWHDPAVDWSSYDLAVIRTPWDYVLRAEEFEAWLDRAGRLTRVLNEPQLVRWNMDKRYLAQLDAAGVPVVPTTYHQDLESFSSALTELGATGSTGVPGHVVVKPAVGAGSLHTGLFGHDDPAAAELARVILAEDGVVMLQPEVPELSEGREKALYVVDGHVTHAIAKGALLARGGGLRGGTYQERPVVVETSTLERSFAERVLAAVSEVTGLAAPLYGRIDTVDSAEHGLVLLEAELFEPFFNLHLVPDVAETFAEAILARA
ncbi:RimK family alpha-L-glutamate ligase [Brachybacterium sp. GCM10030267]|uniref:ATP-grasp domain-containing protein n=1 Tax=Brachybacterium sp. GCM10030267 TaxID=3273381 RepID=UPI00362124F8